MAETGQVESSKTAAAVDAELRAKRPWRTDPHYFEKVQVSSLALLKMAMHAREGEPLEVMGLLQGKVAEKTFIVTDAFALPVEGTETRVNAGAGANEFMVEYMSGSKDAGDEKAVVGWYHSHPGYGCWLSGIDVSTQMLQQTYQDPYLAIVIDPTRTAATGRVEIGAFRTYPENYTPPSSEESAYQSIPLNKIEDFGVHCKRYYPVDVSFFRSDVDEAVLPLLWNKYWISVLSSSPLHSNAEYTANRINDLRKKLSEVEQGLFHGSGLGGREFFADASKGKAKEHKIGQASADAAKLSSEILSSSAIEYNKMKLFSFK
eukprot:CAMPEP_0113883910 /NCGR_PEP_ID=MMETSP0780_2-20120614/9901_1 /TAXON_ID=652834 /ORGANISM="Palpitomonas bilix" /LENGTH=317 /DNA_ID=CAMNT_0000871345 /DNA_START=225 /DNA_END=1178 /DNA_ORIENTATION=+ /assembly_acc=CAM_ASM_000599